MKYLLILFGLWVFGMGIWIVVSSFQKGLELWLLLLGILPIMMGLGVITAAISYFLEGRRSNDEIR